jgi:hypothetical protein
MNKKEVFFNKKIKYTFHKSTPTTQFVQRVQLSSEETVQWTMKHVYWLSFEQVMLNLNCLVSAHELQPGSTVRLHY